MFRQKTKEKQSANLVRCQGIAILISAILLLTALPWFVFTGKAYAAEQVKLQKRNKKKIVEIVTPFDKTYDLDTHCAGNLVANINGRGVGCELHVRFELMPYAYIMSSWSERPSKKNDATVNTTLKPDANGDVSGQIRSSHILYEGTYHLRVWADDGIRAGSNVDVDLHCDKSNIEDYSSSADHAALMGTDINISQKKTHHYMLSGYSDQNDFEDSHRFHVDHKGYILLRTKTDSNTGNVPYTVTLSRDDTKKKLVVHHPGKKQKQSKVKVKPGDYSIDVCAENKSGLTNRQILYSLYVARYYVVKSVKCNHKSLHLYNLSGYRKAKVKATINGGKPCGKWVRYKSGNPGVATVDQKGNIQAKHAGNTVITCYSVEDPNRKATCDVAVATPYLRISSASEEIYVGRKVHLSVTKLPKKLKVTWKSTDPKVAMVSASGVISGRKSGQAKIYAVSKAGLTSAKCTVVVKQKPQPKKPEPDPTPTPDDPTPSPAPAPSPRLSLSSSHLAPRGHMTVRANVAGGTFTTSGCIAISSRSGAACVIRATRRRGEGTITYRVNGKKVSRTIAVY